jgi:hypothetical protein
MALILGSKALYFNPLLYIFGMAYGRTSLR